MPGAQSFQAPFRNGITAGQPVLDVQHHAAQPLQGQEAYAKPGHLSDLLEVMQVSVWNSVHTFLCCKVHIFLCCKVCHLWLVLTNCLEKSHSTLLTDIHF